MLSKVLYVLTSTFINRYGGAETIVHAVNEKYEKLSDMAYSIAENYMLDQGFTYRDEIYSGGQANRYYVDGNGNEVNMQITKVWTR